MINGSKDSFFTTDYTDLHKTIFNLLITDNIYLCKSVQSVVNTSFDSSACFLT